MVKYDTLGCVYSFLKKYNIITFFSFWASKLHFYYLGGVERFKLAYKNAKALMLIINCKTA
jgi:hypothetical protein